MIRTPAPSNNRILIKRQFNWILLTYQNQSSKLWMLEETTNNLLRKVNKETYLLKKIGDKKENTNTVQSSSRALVTKVEGKKKHTNNTGITQVRLYTKTLVVFLVLGFKPGIRPCLCVLLHKLVFYFCLYFINMLIFILYVLINFLVVVFWKSKMLLFISLFILFFCASLDKNRQYTFTYKWVTPIS